MSEELKAPAFTEEELELLAATEEELRNRTAVQCFEESKIVSRIKGGERWQQLMQAHLYYDHVITQMLTDALPNPDAINLRRMSFYQKIRLILAMGLLPQELVTAVEYINNLRNKIAHDLNFEIVDDNVSELERLVGADCLPHGEEALQFNGLLLAALFSIESRRQYHAYRRLYMKKAGLNARKVHHQLSVTLAEYGR